MDDEQISALISLLQEEQVQLLNLIRDLRDRIEILENGGSDALAAEVEEEDHPELAYNTCEDFVDQFVRVIYEAPLVEGARQLLWCDQWIDHPGVSFTMQTLWRSYEEARLLDLETAGGQNLLAWSENYFHPALARVTDVSGPFKLCEANHQSTARLGEHTPLSIARWTEEQVS